MIKSGSAGRVLMLNPEICSGHLNFCDRDSHFIFGDVCTAAIIEREDLCQSENAFEVLATKLYTQFSNNIRNNGGYLNRATPKPCLMMINYLCKMGAAFLRKSCRLYHK